MLGFIIKVTDANTELLKLNSDLGDAAANIFNLQGQLQQAIQYRDAIQGQIDALNNYVTAMNTVTQVLAATPPVALTPKVAE